MPPVAEGDRTNLWLAIALRRNQKRFGQLTTLWAIQRFNRHNPTLDRIYLYSIAME
jgi:hypothetical protein